MSVRLKENTAEWVLDRRYEINRVELKTVERIHTHRFIEIVYTYHGKGKHTVNDREYFVTHGDLLLIDYHCKHTVEPIERLQYVDIMLKPEYVNESLQGTEDVLQLLRLGDFSDFEEGRGYEKKLLHFDGEERKKIEALIEWTEEEQKKEAPGGELMKHSALNLLLSMVFRKMAETDTERLKINEALLSYIDRNCAERLRLDELAARCYYTPEHFARSFKRHTGMTFKEYVYECRIKKAKRMLKKTDLPIEQILSECGFANRTAFFKKFFQSVGQTPLQYRKNQN